MLITRRLLFLCIMPIYSITAMILDHEKSIPDLKDETLNLIQLLFQNDKYDGTLNLIKSLPCNLIKVTKDTQTVITESQLLQLFPEVLKNRDIQVISTHRMVSRDALQGEHNYLLYEKLLSEKLCKTIKIEAIEKIPLLPFLQNYHIKINSLFRDDKYCNECADEIKSLTIDMVKLEKEQSLYNYVNIKALERKIRKQRRKERNYLDNEPNRFDFEVCKKQEENGKQHEENVIGENKKLRDANINLLEETMNLRDENVVKLVENLNLLISEHRKVIQENNEEIEKNNRRIDEITSQLEKNNKLIEKSDTKIEKFNKQKRVQDLYYCIDIRAFEKEIQKQQQKEKQIRDLKKIIALSFGIFAKQEESIKKWQSINKLRKEKIEDQIVNKNELILKNIEIITLKNNALIVQSNSTLPSIVEKELMLITGNDRLLEKNRELITEIGKLIKEKTDEFIENERVLAENDRFIKEIGKQLREQAQKKEEISIEYNKQMLEYRKLILESFKLIAEKNIERISRLENWRENYCSTLRDSQIILQNVEDIKKILEPENSNRKKENEISKLLTITYNLTSWYRAKNIELWHKVESLRRKMKSLIKQMVIERIEREMECHTQIATMFKLIIENSKV